MQNLKKNVSCLILPVAYSSLREYNRKVSELTFEIRKICHCSEPALIFLKDSRTRDFFPPELFILKVPLPAALAQVFGRDDPVTQPLLVRPGTRIPL